MNCPNCGKESVEGAKFCESCGAPLVSEVSKPAAPVPPLPHRPSMPQSRRCPSAPTRHSRACSRLPRKRNRAMRLTSRPRSHTAPKTAMLPPMPIRSRVTTPSPVPRNKTPTRMHTKHRMANLRTKAHTMARFTQCPIPIAHCASLTSSCALFRPSPAPF